MFPVAYSRLGKKNSTWMGLFVRIERPSTSDRVSTKILSVSIVYIVSHFFYYIYQLCI